MLRQLLSPHLHASLAEIVLDFLAFQGKRRWHIDGCFGPIAASPDGIMVFAYQKGISYRQRNGVVSTLLRAGRTTKIACVQEGIVHTCGRSELMSVLDYAGSHLLTLKHPDVVSSIVSLGGNLFASAGGKFVVIWDTVARKGSQKNATIQTNQQVNLIVPLPQDRLAFDCGNAVHVVDALGQVVHSWPTQVAVVQLASFGTRIAARCSTSVHVWDSVTGEFLRSIGAASLIVAWQDMLVVANTSKPTSLSFFDQNLCCKRQLVLPLQATAMVPLTHSQLIVVDSLFRANVYE